MGCHDFDDQNGVMRRQRPAAFRNQYRVRYFFGIANFLNRINDGIGVFLQRVVDAVRRCDFSGLVVDAQPAAHVDIFDIQAALPECGVDTCDLFHRLLEVLNVQNLATQMKMQQLETIGHTSRRQFIDHVDEF